METTNDDLAKNDAENAGGDDFFDMPWRICRTFVDFSTINPTTHRAWLVEECRIYSAKFEDRGDPPTVTRRRLRQVRVSDAAVQQWVQQHT
jgi:hypothetical protein